jgi:hypothetical protein
VEAVAAALRDAAGGLIAGLAAGCSIVSVNIISHRSELIVAPFPKLLYRQASGRCFQS